jgi:Asp-tRNA(Asn)/Glu-tRNA(Gln) amidotransferase C subunit
MARYIEAEKLCKALRDMAFYQNPYKQSTILGVVESIEQFPTADVAPRADYEAVIAGQETLQKYLAKIKAEVAREIFEEIKEQLRGIFDFFRQDNDIRESCAIMFAISEVDKIEKKYTEE